MRTAKQGKTKNKKKGMRGKQTHTIIVKSIDRCITEGGVVFCSQMVDEG